jgi:hypothetical protein
MGCTASTVTNENDLRQALKESIDNTGTTVIVARTSLEDSFLDVASSLSGRQVESIDNSQ